MSLQKEIDKPYELRPDEAQKLKTAAEQADSFTIYVSAFPQVSFDDESGKNITTWIGNLCLALNDRAELPEVETPEGKQALADFIAPGKPVIFFQAKRGREFTFDPKTKETFIGRSPTGD